MKKNHNWTQNYANQYEVYNPIQYIIFLLLGVVFILPIIGFLYLVYYVMLFVSSFVKRGKLAIFNKESKVTEFYKIDK